MEFQKFVLEKQAKNEGASIYRVDELNDGCLIVQGGGLIIYNLTESDFWKNELRLDLGYIVSYKQLKSGNIVVCSYGGLMAFFDLTGKIVQAIKSEQSEREDFVDELSNGKLISMGFYGRMSLYDNIDGTYKKIKSFEKLDNFRVSSIIDLSNGIIVLRGWDLSTKDYPVILFDLNNLTYKTIKDNCISVQLMDNGNLAIFTKKTVEFFSIAKFKTISVFNIPDNIKVLSTCLYDNHTIFLGNDNGEGYEFVIKDNLLVQVDKFNIKGDFDNNVNQIIKLKNGKVIFVVCSLVYLYKPI